MDSLRQAVFEAMKNDFSVMSEHNGNEFSLYREIETADDEILSVYADTFLPERSEAMNNQNILNQLSEIESVLYYRMDGSDDPEGVSYADLEEVHNLINEALKAWNRATGCILEP